MKIFRIIIFLVLLFSIYNVCNAQNKLLDNKSFFTDTVKQWYSEWLAITKINSVIKVDSVHVDRNDITLYLRGQYENDDSLAVAWHNLKELTSDKNFIHKLLINKFAFLSQIGIDSTTILINHNNRFFNVRIDEKNDLIKVKEKSPPIGNKGNEKIKIKPSEFKIKTYSDKNSTIEKTRTKLREKFKSYYNGLKDMPIVETRKDRDNELVLVINKIKKEIVRSHNYLENIRLEFTIYEINNEIKIRYSIDAGYAGGAPFGWSPRNYYPTELDFPREFKDYKEKIIEKYIDDIIQ